MDKEDCKTCIYEPKNFCDGIFCFAIGRKPTDEDRKKCEFYEKKYWSDKKE